MFRKDTFFYLYCENCTYCNLKICVCYEGGFDEAFLKDALLERLKDDVPDVVLSALSALRVGELPKSYG